MKVKELIKMLKEENQEAEVIMSSDGEGNSYSPFADFGDTDSYLADSTCSGQMGYSKFTMKLQEDGYSKEDVIKDGVPALVLFPVN